MIENHIREYLLPRAFNAAVRAGAEIMRVYAERDDLGELPDGTYYICDLIGLDVVTDEGKEVGKMTDCFPTGSNDVYVVKPPKGKDILLPAIPQVIKEVRLDEGKMIVTLMKGLVDDEV